MRCDCCDRELNDFEATRRSAVTGEFLNTCNSCLKGLGIDTIDRHDLNPFAPAASEMDEEDDFYIDLEDEDDVR